MLEFFLNISHFALPVTAVLVVVLCLSALLKRHMPPLGNAFLINTANGDRFPLRYRETSVGRHKNCDIILSYGTVSRLHGVVVCSKKGWYVADTRSSTGVSVNGKKIEKRQFIKNGDKIGFGGAVMIFENKVEKYV